MVMGIRTSHVIALAIVAGVAGWMYNGDVVIGGRADAGTNSGSAGAQNDADETKPFRVRVVNLIARDRQAELEVRGRTRADLRVPVRAETSGKIITRPVEEGMRVSAGDILCVIERGARDAHLLRAQAQFAQAELEHSAASKLSKKGFSSRTTLRSSKAALDAAKAMVAEAELDIQRTEIRAPIDGVIHEPYAEVGDMLSVGGVCATILDADPMLMTGQVSERDIATLKNGMFAKVALVTGEEISGQIRYIAPAADERTRTFRVDIVMDNGSDTLRDGVTATATIPLPATKAHLVSPSFLVLRDDGKVGVRAVGADNRVEFHPVKILGAEREGVWVSDLPSELRVITVGQDYVVVGQNVEPVVVAAETLK